MKVRLGFVSNSSSSSFVVAVKGDVQMTKDELVKIFSVSNESPIRKLSEDIAGYIIDNSEEVNEKFITDNYGYTSLQEAVEDDLHLAKLIQDGFTVRHGWASYNEGDAVEILIGNGAIKNMVTDKFVFEVEH